VVGFGWYCCCSSEVMKVAGKKTEHRAICTNEELIKGQFR
jgi:hypothetical protein